VLWATTAGASTIPSSTSADGIVYVPANGLTALDPGELTADGEPKLLWNAGKLGPGTGSPVVVGGRVYVVNGSGVLTAADAATGKELYRVRLEGKGGASATPIVSNGHLYLVDKAGLLQVVRLDADGGEVVATLDLATEVQGTPAAANGALYVRAHEHLWRIGQ
jgi:outer membrane protein assembly factor BamB